LIKKEVRIASELCRLCTVREAFLTDAKVYNIAEDTLFDIRLAFDEALANAITHGNKNRPDLSVTVRWKITKKAVVLQVADEGNGFNPRTVPCPAEEKQLLCPKGRGLFLIRNKMDSVRFNKKGNVITMEKRLIQRS